jgi:Family of unknown function (DUF5946)
VQDRQPHLIPVGTPCTECGLQTGNDEPTCAQMFDALVARDFERPALFWKSHRLMVDAYALQHEPYVKSAKSLAAHLCGAGIAFEHGGDPTLLSRLRRWLSTNPSIVRPALPKNRGALTVAHVYGIDDPVDYGRRVNEWAMSAWQAYAAMQPLAREWIALTDRTR